MSGPVEVNAAGMQLDRAVHALRIAAGVHICAAIVAAFQFATHLASTSFVWTGLPKGMALRALMTFSLPLWPYAVSWLITRRRLVPMDGRLIGYIAAFVLVAAAHLCVMRMLMNDMTVVRYLLWTIPLFGSLVALAFVATSPVRRLGS
jgi:hypothetical protein